MRLQGADTAPPGNSGQTLEDAELQPDVICYSGVISACAKGGRARLSYHQLPEPQGALWIKTQALRICVKQSGKVTPVSPTYENVWKDRIPFLSIVHSGLSKWIPTKIQLKLQSFDQPWAISRLLATDSCIAPTTRCTKDGNPSIALLVARKLAHGISESRTDMRMFSDLVNGNELVFFRGSNSLAIDDQNIY